MQTNKKINVEVAYALSNRQSITSLEVPEGTTALEAVKISNICAQFSDIDLDNLQLGIFNKVVTAQKVLRQNDRVEIYRPLIADPKAVRRARAESKSKKDLEA